MFIFRIIIVIFGGASGRAQRLRRNIMSDAMKTIVKNILLAAHVAAALILAAACGESPAAPDPDKPPVGPSEPENPPVVPPVFDWPDPDYESSDYSADGRVEVLQLASEGRGIDVVFMGDGFSDRLVANGHYAGMMNRAVEAFFSEEPMRSFRRLFNVYSVTAVSTNEVVGGAADTALDCDFEDGTTVITGDDGACFAYAQCVPELCGDVDRLNELVIVVVVNEIRWAGTCYPYGPWSVLDGGELAGDYGRGFAVTYSAYADFDDLTYTVVHEAVGHGFAKLADEYYTPGESLPESDRLYYEITQPFGYWRNVDFSGSADGCAWRFYLGDGRYAGTDVGYFAGGCYCESGVWRSSRQSLMFYTEGGFNAVSRESIYRRIHSLAYGESWSFDAEKFAEWDLNRVQTSAAPRRSVLRGRAPLPQPRVVAPGKRRLQVHRGNC